MYARINSYVLDGLTAQPVTVTLGIDAEQDGFRVAGLADRDALELKEKLRSAIVSAGFKFPSGRLVFCFSTPVGEPRQLAQLDLAMAAALLAASAQLAPGAFEGIALVGELRADGTLAFLRGAMQMAEAVLADPDIRALALAAASAPLAARVRGIELLQIHSLAALRHLDGEERSRLRARLRPSRPDRGGPDLSALPASRSLLRGVEIAVAGEHPLLLRSPDGLDAERAVARSIVSLLPPLSAPESLEVLRIASSCEEVDASTVSTRPFRAAGPGADAEAIFGAGWAPIPGEAIRTHLGVFYLGALGQIEEELWERIWIAHAASSAMVGIPPRPMPCAFFLVASAGPNPSGDPRAEGSRGAQSQVGREPRALAARFQRFEVLAGAGSAESLQGDPGAGESAAAVRRRVIEARARQEARLGEGRTNCQMSLAEVEDCGLHRGAAAALARSYPYPDQAGQRIRVARVARTVADLDGAEAVEPTHAEEALLLAPDRL